MTDAPCRLLQRDDNAAGSVQSHARLDVAGETGSRPTSTQQQHAPRVGETNRYS